MIAFSPTRLWSKWRQLDRRSRAAALEAAFILLACAIGARIVGPARMQRFVSLESAPEGASAVGMPGATHLGELVNAVAASLPLPVLCLPRSLALVWMLSRRQTPARLCFGVRKESESWEGHAWVECEGRPVNDDEAIAGRFAPLVPPAT